MNASNSYSTALPEYPERRTMLQAGALSNRRVILTASRDGAARWTVESESWQ